MKVKVIGGGLAGSEAALYLANNDVEVELYEMRPNVETGAHTTSNFAEFVCSNSLGSASIEGASGLLKEEARLLGSVLIQEAHNNSVPAGGSLSIDREGFSEKITNLIENNENIKIIREEIEHIPEGPTIIASGPLTSPKLSKAIIEFSGCDNFSFYDAIAPIVERDSIDFNKAYLASRYDKGTADYINCPLNKEEYENFYNILINAEKIFDPLAQKYFESCLPIEVLASRGFDTLCFGPMKPVGLLNKHNGEHPYAVVQLRQDDKEAKLYNLVGFQTNLKWGEQKKLLQSIPGLENASIIRYGVMHANSFINSPKVLTQALATKTRPDLFFAGQITGVEGYSESIATGLLAGINMLRFLNNEAPLSLDSTTMLGALVEYITFGEHKKFQPVNSNWGIIKEIEVEKKDRKNKKLKRQLMGERSLGMIKSLGLT